jgi:glutathione peroxidase
MTNSIYDERVRTLDGTEGDLHEYEGKVMLVVNTASKCGFTPQFAGLEELHQKYKDQGLAILGFPCNQFGGQDPGSNAEIGEFCTKNYGVSFPMHEKIEVNGSAAHPLFKRLKKDAKGILGSEVIKWNFTKFLVDQSGNVVKRYAPNTTPTEIAADVEGLLKR